MSDYLLENYQNEESLDKKAIREGFGAGIVDAADQNDGVVVLNADLPGSLKLSEFQNKYPKRYIQVGVAEQNMAGMATGLEHYGKVPFITSFAAFSPGLNFSQIRLALMGDQNIKLVGSHYGLNTGPDGASAQMNADVAMMKALPGITVITAADYNQAIQATNAIAEREGACYLRVTREKFPVFLKPDAEFMIGKAQKLMNGDDITVIVTGAMVYEAIQALLPIIDEGLSVDLLNLHTVKPLDKGAIVESARKTGRVVVIEEHNIIGGLGESVSSVLSQHAPTKMKLIGVKDTFGESGEARELWSKYGLDRDSIRKEIANFE